MWRGNLKTALASLRASKWRSLLTMMGVIIGISSVVTVVSLGNGLKHQIVGQIDQLGSDVLTVRSGKLTNQTSGASNLNILGFFTPSNITPADVTAISKVPSAQEVVPFDFITNTVKSNNVETNSVSVLGTTPAIQKLMAQKMAYGSFFTDDNKGKSYAVIGTDVAHQVFGEFNPVGKTLQIEDQDFIVRGVLEPTSGGMLSVAQTNFDTAVLIPFDLAQKLAGGHNNILQVLFRAKDGNTTTARAEVQKALIATHGHEDFSILKQDQLLSVADGVVNKITGFVSVIAGISLLVGGIGIMDIMLVSVSERTREIGLRKAVGATNRQILSQFLVEGLVLSVGGGLIGIATSLLINFGLRVYTNWQPIISLQMLLVAVSVSVGIGIIFSTTPAIKAAKKDPIEALRA